ncbi:RNA polymerase sigma factor [Mucilaginibacter aquaedulcis]|uniref:RNA polymerase sigma factor n=1 Tax=Mucilaginibacter aquaedulcis TaxID=1187081 RepID=UPI0025B50036|nr:RNA polymerase sigma factor [Mucilaginibacter aquaedulcis]MDN3550230.1 RNA polymerase sigma factor [Mucilaginibacter aquaedulcis]
MLPTLPVKAIEHDFIARLKLKCPITFGILYKRYSKNVYKRIIFITKNKQTAEDVLQKTFTKAWCSIQAYEPCKASLYTWLIIIAKRTSLDELRYIDYRNSMKCENLEECLDLIDHSYNYELYPDGIGVQKAIQQLKREHKIILSLVYFQGYTLLQTASTLHLPLGTVKSRLRAGLKKLRLYYYTDELQSGIYVPYSVE